MDIQQALLKAIKEKNLKLIQYYVKNGADLNKSMPPIGMTPFLYAMNYFKDGERIEALIDMGGDVNKTNKNGETPLMRAVEGQCEAIVPWLFVDSGANLDAQDIWGNTALMRVLLDPHIGRKKKLLFAFLDYKADLTNLKNDRGQTAWDILWDLITHKLTDG